MTQQRERTATPVAEFLQRHPRLEFVEAFLSDVNGIARGKRLPAHALERLYGDGLCLPASTVLLDIWGNEVEATGLIFDTGDADRYCHPVPDGLRPLPWSDGRGAQLLLAMHDAAGAPWIGDPRNVLAAVAARFRARGQNPVVATELEFRLFDPEPAADGSPRPLASLGQGASQLFGMEELDVLDGLFSDIDRACAEQDLPADTVIAEQSDGQYEVNLRHVADPLLAADQAVLFKRTVKAVARRHGLVASFMAKPYGDQAGNGLHIHVSLLDDDGGNLFTGDEAAGQRLRHAVGGLTQTMPDAMALFAPHANSWRRFQPHAHVPLAPTWGRDNRTTAVRIPLSKPEATRVEHRVAGADANPYLVVAAVLAGMEHGLERALEPPPETRGNAFEQAAAAALPTHWDAALRAFEASDFISAALDPEYRRLYSAVKRQELETFRRRVPRDEYETYLTTT